MDEIKRNRERERERRENEFGWRKRISVSWILPPLRGREFPQLFLSVQLSCFSPRCLGSREIVERSIYGYKITHVKFEIVLLVVFAGKIYTRALVGEKIRRKDGGKG